MGSDEVVMPEANYGPEEPGPFCPRCGGTGYDETAWGEYDHPCYPCRGTGLAPDNPRRAATLAAWAASQG